jgi:hypothetical protein
MNSDQDQYNELAFYTLAHKDPAFIHQHLVDAFLAQHADRSTKPITLVFALIGLYLHVEKGYTGKQVQLAHMQMAKRRKQWVQLPISKKRGSITAADVLAATPGSARDAMIDTWSASVWEAWKDSHAQIAELARVELGVD